MLLAKKPKKTKSGQYSTSEETLLKLKDEHPIIDAILTFRAIKKLVSTYVDALPVLVNKIQIEFILLLISQLLQLAVCHP